MVQNALPDPLFIPGLCCGDGVLNECTGTVGVPCWTLPKVITVESLQASIRSVCACVRACLCGCGCVCVSYSQIDLSVSLVCTSVWREFHSFATPVTATPRALTDGIYVCSMSKCFELDPQLWSWKAPSKTWNILIRSREIYLWTCLGIRRQEICDLNESALQHIHALSFHLGWMIRAETDGSSCQTLSSMWQIITPRLCCFRVRSPISGSFYDNECSRNREANVR